MAVTLDIGLIVVACIIPFVLIFFNLVVMAHYIDPEAAAGHFIAKFFIVSRAATSACARACARRARVQPRPRASGRALLPQPAGRSLSLPPLARLPAALPSCSCSACLWPSARCCCCRWT